MLGCCIPHSFHSVHYPGMLVISRGTTDVIPDDCMEPPCGLLHGRGANDSRLGGVIESSYSRLGGCIKPPYSLCSDCFSFPGKIMIRIA